MINCQYFYQALLDEGISFFTGVPDSLLKSFCAYVSDHADPGKHIIAANEGSAIALASGYHIATGKVGLVYMQNSGMGNAVNPILSLADPEVYSIPVLLLIGWRGRPGVYDEPQHIKQGRITAALLDSLEVPYKVLSGNFEEAKGCIKELFAEINKRKGPVALLVEEDTFEPYKAKAAGEKLSDLSREQAIRAVIDKLDDFDVVVSTTGKTSRELYEYRDKTGGDHSRDFLTIGSMGHCSQIALAIALSKPDRSVYCLDGDGSVLMHMGSVAVTGSLSSKNFRHIVFNNGCHDSVGGQPTCGFSVSFTGIAEKCGYKFVERAETIDEINEKIQAMRSVDGPAMLEIIVQKGAREDLGRPKMSLKQRKEKFMKFLGR